MLNDTRLRRPSAPRTLHVGDLKVSYVPDGAMPLKPAGPPHPAAYRACLNDTGHLVANIGGSLVRCGNPGPEGIEVVAFTRLHLDHVGWASVRPPVFTRATFVVPAGAWEGPVPVPPPALRRRQRRVVPGEEVFPGVHVLALPGHTGFTITSRGERLVAFGVALHSPVQVRHPEWSPPPDPDPRGAPFRDTGTPGREARRPVPPSVGLRGRDGKRSPLGISIAVSPVMPWPVETRRRTRRP
ncbi:MBL fold metallo-hydrolase [Streptomyces triticirhizae]|uniref:hypothetical protein n=1 Tax=Streptomyces triticirhizae TaxID=2483353 RepID=UPI0011C3F596|nr:hypothetical protein [Streptomyces triticirhizae]